MVNALDKVFCEPFRAWNRLETRCRKVNFDRVLKCQIHDPLWMLTRQWQFGEFKGEDTGSPIFAKALVASSKITLYQPQNHEVENYNDQIPLEAVVESEPERRDFKARIQTAAYLMRLLDNHGQALNRTNPPVPYNRSEYLTTFKDHYPIDPIGIDDQTDSNQLIIEKAKLLANQKLKQLMQAVSPRTFNGLELHRDLKTNTFNSLFAQLGFPNEHRTMVQTAMQEFETLVDHKLNFFAAAGKSAWNENQLEYQFSCGIPSADGDNTVLKADEYYTGRLDWYAFDLEANPADQIKAATPAMRAAAQHQEVLSFIPTAVKYRGMPNARWWEFEDGYVNFGEIHADTTDIAKIILAEFALVYGNNWFIFPWPLAVGSLAEVKGIVVTDVFDQRTLIAPVPQGDSDDWMGWGLFNLSPRAVGTDPSGQPLKADSRLFMPPVVVKVQEGEPLEEIYMVRDEMANMVWGIEGRIPDLTGQGMDGYAAANELHNLLGFGADLSGEPEIHEDAVLKYTLANTVPENWIPFIPVHRGDDQNRQIKLQRASMPRLFRENFQPVRPRTDLLRYGLPQQIVDPDVSNDEQLQPYFIHEEEVPKIGIRAIATLQRTRWLAGKVISWYGRRKMIGRGTGASGLAFDLVEPVGIKNTDDSS